MCWSYKGHISSSSQPWVAAATEVRGQSQRSLVGVLCTFPLQPLLDGSLMAPLLLQGSHSLKTNKQTTKLCANYRLFDLFMKYLDRLTLCPIDLVLPVKDKLVECQNPVPEGVIGEKFLD